MSEPLRDAPRTDVAKLVALAACAMLFIACIGVAAFNWEILAYRIFGYRKPPPPPHIVQKDLTQEVAGAFQRGRVKYQVAKAAFDAGDSGASLALFQEAKDIWASARDQIVDFRALEEGQGPEYARWEKVAEELNSAILLASEDIFRLEVRISMARSHLARSPPANPPPGAPAAPRIKTQQDLDMENQGPTESERGPR